MTRLAKEPRRFIRAAEQRLEEAQFLVQNDYTTASVYLAGYAVECMLKALILASEPQAHHPRTMKSFHGATAHNFEWLREQLRNRHVYLSDQIAQPFGTINRWTTSLRYDPVVQKTSEAEAFMRASQEVILWIKERL